LANLCGPFWWSDSEPESESECDLGGLWMCLSSGSTSEPETSVDSSPLSLSPSEVGGGVLLPLSELSWSESPSLSAIFANLLSLEPYCYWSESEGGCCGLGGGPAGTFFPLSGCEPSSSEVGGGVRSESELELELESSLVPILANNFLSLEPPFG